ncbi:MAG: V-type ATP synthase subunit D [Acutalibacteraceae bacterium]|nr:V-type ATP synthase subunit D [Acutalibacteraceae bacterium]
MANNAVATKGNLINTKKSLALAKVGYDLMDKKRNILIREMMTLIDKANEIQGKIDDAYSQAYQSLQTANITLGFNSARANSIPVENSLQLSYRSVMGVEIPIVTIDCDDVKISLDYGMYATNGELDEARFKFVQVKRLTADLAEIENSVYRLAVAIKTTQRRANALKNIMIPRFESNVKFITDALDEMDREEFSRMKVIKSQKQSKELQQKRIEAME